MGLLKKIVSKAKAVVSNVQSKGGLKNVVAVGKSIITGKGVTANTKNATINKVLEKVGTRTGILSTAAVGAVGVKGAKAAITAVRAKKAVSVANASKTVKVGAKVKDAQTQTVRAVNEAQPNQPMNTGTIATGGKVPKGSTSQLKTTSSSNSVKQYRGNPMRSRKRTALWYKRQTELLKAKKEYAKAKGY
jgi:flagellar biosynthesis GTPase FlhF